MLPWTLGPAPMDKRVEEPEGWVCPWSREHLVFLFLDFRESPLSLLPSPDGLECGLPPSCPRTASANKFSSYFVTDLDRTVQIVLIASFQMLGHIPSLSTASTMRVVVAAG